MTETLRCPSAAIRCIGLPPRKAEPSTERKARMRCTRRAASPRSSARVGTTGSTYIGDTVVGGAGIDTLVTYWGGFTLPDDVENLVVTGTGAWAHGNSLDNLIAGGPGQQTFFGGGGHDVFTGGADSDIFVSSKLDHGNVVVNDFQVGVDKIRLEGFAAFTSFAAVKNAMTQVGTDAVVAFGDGQTLTLRGHQTTDFTSADFWTGIDLGKVQLSWADEFDAFDSSPDGSHGWRTTLDWGAARCLPTTRPSIIRIRRSA
jgi:hypothetical protein